jgi:TRAP-type C4-dicarboxylate transport system permease small subunit
LGQAPAPGRPVAFARPVDRVLGTLDRLVRAACVLTIGGMVVLVAAQVFARYVLNNSIGWADEVARLLFVWSIFLAIPVGIPLGSHIGITLLTDRLPEVARAMLARAMAAVAAALTLLVAWQSFAIAIAQWDELMVSIDLSAGLFLLAVGVGGLLAALHLLRIAVLGPYPVEQAA